MSHELHPSVIQFREQVIDPFQGPGMIMFIRGEIHSIVPRVEEEKIRRNVRASYRQFHTIVRKPTQLLICGNRGGAVKQYLRVKAVGRNRQISVAVMPDELSLPELHPAT